MPSTLLKTGKENPESQQDQTMHLQLDGNNFYPVCDLLGEQDAALKNILAQYGYPPFWTREPGFETLIHIILEQQVSLAAAKAALVKLQARLGIVTPANLLALSDEELKACYFSRQKIIYARNLAHVIISGQIDLERVSSMPDEEVKLVLTGLKGIGEWTADIYLMMALHRPDCFPLGDVALISSLKQVKDLPRDTPPGCLMTISDGWKPFRTVAAYLLWHSYLCRKAAVGKRVNSELKSPEA
jgi:DNA-3-methyladenine glycosylase II